MNRKTQNHLKKVPVVGGLHDISPKTIAAVVLLAVMALLWGRVLLSGKSGPAAVQAQEVQPLQEQPAVQTTRPEKILPVKLDVLEGRNDVLSGNLFSAANWKAFDLVNGKNEVSVDMTQAGDDLGKKRHQSNLEKIAQTLKLEAVVQGADGKPYQVFVNDAVLTVGSVLTVKEGPDPYELVLKEIKESEALFVWNDISVILKMTEMINK